MTPAQEIAKLQRWIEIQSDVVKTASKFAYEQFKRGNASDENDLRRCLQLSEQLSDARRCLADLTIGKFRRV